ncbi:MAG TPA: ATP synthase F1 subunit epsilon [Phycisphaerae bacterium]|nr:ATP synthase F1 subunit epsilon [Phycisphaerae bacterium]HNU45039.1 ATP synthase F1 subunit epsilon [Phycisphaerae bacterium]
MPKIETFECNVITPERTVLQCQARFVAFPAHDGEMGILPNRAPLVCRLGVGLLRIDAETEKHVLLIEGGFAQMARNRLTILAEQASRAGDIDAGEAARALADARQMQATDDASTQLKARAIQRARARQRFAAHAT